MKSKERSDQPERRPYQPEIGQSRLATREYERNLPVCEIEGKRDLMWWEVLSEDGRKLYQILSSEQGDTGLLPGYAAAVGFDLNAAMDELRRNAFLNESDPLRVKLRRVGKPD